jgi:peptidyl-tRNA hydrolase
MRRIFIIRKDLHLSPGKLAAQVGHAAELYWINILKNGGSYTNYSRDNNPTAQSFEFFVPYEVWTDYINGIFTKTICESRNLNHLLKAKAIADELGLKENEDYGFINDKCLTELKPENEDGTTTVGMWFAPLADEIAHKISKKFPLLKDHADFRIPLRDREWTINWHKCGDGKEYTFKTRCPTEIDAFNALLQSEPGMCAGDIIVNSLYS